MCARIHGGIDAQRVATDHAAGWVHQIDVAWIPFGVEGPLNDERTFVVALDQARSSLAERPGHVRVEAQAKFGLPSGSVVNGRGVQGSHTVRC